MRLSAFRISLGEKQNSILISESTYQQVKLFVHANQWRVKKFADKEGVMDIYEVVGKKEISDPGYQCCRR